jgi:NAD(P)H-hydrate epimerase
MEMMRIPLLSELPAGSADGGGGGGLDATTDVILDAIFGFSFSGAVRAPFDAILPALRASSKPLVSVDIPSGWDVERGPPADGGLAPDVLVSLTAPKACAAHFRGRQHFLGGRFVSPHIAEKYNIVQPHFAGTEQVVLLDNPER